MRIKFELGIIKYNELTVVTILNVSERVMGIVVNGVLDVISQGLGQMRLTPEFGAVINIEYITGLGTVDDRMLILVDIERLMIVLIWVFLTRL